MNLNADLSRIKLNCFGTTKEKHNLPLDAGFILKYRHPVDSLAHQDLESTAFQGEFVQLVLHPVAWQSSQKDDTMLTLQPGL